MDWEIVIGLEVHAQLNTRSKIFSGAATAYGAAPNTQACNIDIALPGVLPVFNVAARDKAIRFGLAVGASISPVSVFARKNYFYPDLPKGYQISQYELPIVDGGEIPIVLEDGEKIIRLVRAHLEEDAGKSLHEDFHGMTGVDLNRAGTPLLEIVSHPDLRGAKEAVAYARALHALVRYLDICDGNMQEGSFRCDANVSVRRRGDEKLGTRCEIKNLNSFRFLERAIEFEAARQIDIIEAGGSIAQETRLYDSVRDETRSMRSKEEANDYRYFPDPDLPPLRVAPALVEEIRASLPELPHVRRHRFMQEYGLPRYDADVLTSSREMAEYYEGVTAAVGSASAKLAANWVMGEFSAAMNRDAVDITAVPVSAGALGGLVARIADDTISGKIAKEVFEAMWREGRAADEIIEARGLRQITDAGAIEKLVDDIIAANPGQLAQYRAGKDKLFGFFVGQAMKASGGKVNPQALNDMLRRKLAG